MCCVFWQLVFEGVLALKEIKQSSTQENALNALDHAQRKHQELFIAAHGASRLRPKHHYRLHHPCQYKQHACFLDTFPIEAKHQLYKKMLANSLAGEWQERSGLLSQCILKNVLLKTTVRLRERPWVHRLMEPVHQGRELSELTGIHDDCRISRGCYLGSLELQPDDVLFFAAKDGQEAGVFQFCVEYKSCLMLVIESLRELDAPVPKTRLFARDGIKKAVCVLHMVSWRQPTWWTLHEGGRLLCLP